MKNGEGSGLIMKFSLDSFKVTQSEKDPEKATGTWERAEANLEGTN